MSLTERPIPLAYHITFRCYGTWLPGDERGCVNRYQNEYNTPLVKANTGLEKRAKVALNPRSYKLDKASRKIVLDAIVETCKHRNWKLYAVHARSNHIHMVVMSSLNPNDMLRIVKAYCTRALNRVDNNQQLIRWSRHGSTQYLWRDSDVNNAIRYIVSKQGEQMALYVIDWWK